MKICLVTPPSPFLLDEKVFCSLGILKIGAVLEQSGAQVDHIDLAGVSNYDEAIADYMGHPDAFAITATTPQYPSALHVRRVLQKSHPNTRVIIGGPHPTLIHAAAKRGSDRAKKALVEILKDFDVVVAGDGEKAIFSAISPFIKGLVDADDPKSALWNTSKDFTESPWPARHLIDLESYHYSIEGERALHLVSQLGCPMSCTFCSGRNSPMLRYIRLRPPENVIEEILYLHKKYGYRAWNFFDDELNVNREMLSLMRLLKQKGDDLGVEWKLRGFIKAELFNEEQAKAMYEAGFRWILTGFEAGSDRILVNINKRATKADNTRCIQIAHDHGLKVKALMSLGHAGESKQSAQDMYDWLIETKPDDLDVTVITPYPGSPYWDEAVPVAEESGHYCYTSPKTGDRLFMEEVDFRQTADYYKGIPGEYVSHVWTDHLSSQELVQLRDKLEFSAKKDLGIQMLQAAASSMYDHSMGMTPSILKTSSAQ